MPGRARWEGSPARRDGVVVRWPGRLAFQLGVTLGRLCWSVLQSQGSSPPTIIDSTCHPDFHPPSMKPISIFDAFAVGGRAVVLGLALSAVAAGVDGFGAAVAGLARGGTAESGSVA